MCGRYVLREVIKLREKLERLRTRRLQLELRPRFNVAPSQSMPVVVQRDGPKEVLMRWGPTYALAGKSTLQVNARSETAASKPTFRDAMLHRRCLVPADGFFEWQRLRTAKLPFLFQVNDGDAFWMAGIYEEATDAAPESFLVLTTGANALMAAIHDRMPVIFDDEAAAEWIAPGAIVEERLRMLLVPYPADEMNAMRVTTSVNDARNDSPACVQPYVEPSATEFRLE